MDVFANTPLHLRRLPVVRWTNGLKKACPTRRRFNLPEDNDPGGFKTKAAQQVRAEMCINVFNITKRSPQLNALDYAVNRWMRAKEGRLAAKLHFGAVTLPAAPPSPPPNTHTTPTQYPLQYPLNTHTIPTGKYH